MCILLPELYQYFDLIINFIFFIRQLNSFMHYVFLLNYSEWMNSKFSELSKKKKKKKKKEKKNNNKTESLSISLFTAYLCIR